MDPDRADLDLGHPPRVRAQEEDVARGRLDGEVLVHRADRHPVGIEHDAVVAGLRDGAAAGQRGQPRAPPGAEPPVDGVVMQVRAAAAPARLDPPARQRHHVVEVLPGQCRVRGRVPWPWPTSPRPRARRWTPPPPPTAAPARRAGPRVARGDRAGPPARRRGGRCTPRARRASSGRGGPPACRRGGGWPGPRAGERCRWRGASRSGRPARPGPRRSPARATPSPRARAGRRPADGFRRCAAAPPTGCRGGRRPGGRRRRRHRRAVSSSPRRSANWWATRSAILRVLTNTSVVRWWRV